MLNYIGPPRSDQPSSHQANPPFDHKSDNVTILSLLITAAVALGAIGVLTAIALKVSDILNQVMAGEQSEPALVITAPAAPNSPEPTSTSPAASPPAESSSSSVTGGSGAPLPSVGDLQIDHCNGYIGMANFRAYPSFAPTVVKGAVMRGEWVNLTGASAWGDGILWYEAVNRSPLMMSEDGFAMYHQPQPNQVGWIAACFVE